MRFYISLVLLLLLSLSNVGFAQSPYIDSIKHVLSIAKEDTNKVNTLISLCRSYFDSDPAKAIEHGIMARDLAAKLAYKKGEAVALKNIGIGYYTQGKYLETLEFWNQSLAMFEAIGDKTGVANILSNIGAIYFDQSDDAKALEFYLKSLKMAERIPDTLRIATALINIGAVYFNKVATHDRALSYYLKALPLCETLGDQEAIGMASVNLGEIYFTRDDYKSAMFYFEKSIQAYIGFEENMPYSLNNLGKVYAKRGDYQEAIKYQLQGFEIAKKLDAKLDIAQSLISLGETYFLLGDIKSALTSYMQSLDFAREIGSKTELEKAYEGLALSYSELSDYTNAFKYQLLLTGIKDTIYNIATDKKLASLQFDFDIQKKQGQIDLLTKDKELQELDLQRQKLIRNLTIAGLGVVLLFLVVVFFQKKKITIEKQRSEALLLNILPEETAEELKATGTAKAKSFDLVTVLFTDFKNFTQASELLSAEELVQEINYCYCEFDRIITKYGIEKIKTIGDAYMCAGGLPVTNQTHPFDVITAGLEMQEFIARNKAERMARNQPFFELRLGIHTGPVVAGIVGIKKFAYDIWGDTVNTASRMESSGETGKVNISGTTFEIVKDRFVCTHRGKIKAKNKGEIDMYFVESAVMEESNASNQMAIKA